MRWSAKGLREFIGESGIGNRGKAKVAGVVMVRLRTSNRHADRAALLQAIPDSAFPVPGLQTLRVATAGGTREARNAGPSTASWPSSHRLTKPIGT